MKLKLLDKLIMLSKLSLYGLVIQCFMLSSIWAEDISAQKIQSVGDVMVEMGFTKAKLEKVFKLLENQTDFHFSYSKEDIDPNLNITFEKGQTHAVRDVLMEVSKKSGLRFRQVNRNIIVQKGDKVGTNESVVEVFIKDIEIEGKITDENGEGLPGASVIEKGTTNGTTTDLDGNYKLDLPDNASLVISFVGYKTQEVAIAGKSTIDVQMELDAEKLEEVVVVGYGTQKRSDVTGSIASVEGAQISKQGTVNVSQALQGQVPGVSVVNTSGRPGAQASIVIRGQGSFGSTAPLYVVDGAIVGGIDFLSPENIQSIEILKDASAAAIYGSRAANGVVIVTTKRGENGKTKLTFTSNYGIQSLGKRLDFATSQEWRDKEVWKFENEGVQVPVNLQDGNFDPSISTDWQEILYRPAVQQNYNLSYSGGTENSNFNFALGYVDQEGILIDSDFHRFNLRLNSDVVFGRFKFGESIAITRSFAVSTTPTSFQEYTAPVLQPQDEDGNFQVLGAGWGLDPAQTLAIGNPLANIKVPDRESSNINTVTNIYGQVELVEGLSARTSASVQWTTTHGKTFVPEFAIGHITNPIADLSESRGENYTVLWENTLSFIRRFGDHQINLVTGWTRQFDQSRSINLNAEGFPPGLFQASAAETILPNSGGGLTEVALESYLARANYSYKSRYLLTTSIRQDASSRLIKELRKGTFMSFSLAWMLSEESFFPVNSFINTLKLRGGYGELGRLNSVGAYQVQNTLALGGANVDYILGSSQELANGVTQDGITNQALLWERAQSSNFALDASLLDNKLSLTVEYFIKNTNDLQFGAPIPFTVGTNATSILVNAGDIQNKGFEFVLGYNGKVGDFNYTVTGNLYTYQNKVVELRTEEDAFVGGQYGFGGQNATRTEVGRSLSNFWLLRTDGIFKSQDEVDAHSKDGVLIQPNAQPGDLRYKDINDDGIINADDKEYIDGSIPDFEYGINFNGSYKNFDLGLVLQGVAGQKLFDGVSRAIGLTLADRSTDFWREDNLDAEFFRPSISDPNANRGDNDFYLKDAGYLRLRSVQLGYSLPESVLSKLGLSSVRVSVTGQNLFTFTGFDGYNPENVSFGLNRGVNTNVYPLTKTILFGLNIDF